MKNLMILIALILSANVAVSQSSYKISPRLQDLMNKSGEEKLDIIVELSEQIDLDGMHERFRQQKLSQQERIRLLLPALQNKAANTQGELLRWLEEKRNISTAEIKNYWIFNGLALSATVADIQAMAEHKAIAALDWDAPVYVEEYTCEEIVESGASPNGVEPGLNLINAAPLWALGYTGYGTIAFSSDTGIEGFHPAYANRWIGSYDDLDAAWFVTGGSNGIPSNCGDHGTHTLGTMVGLDHVTNDTIGVAFHANWIAARNICGGGTSTNIDAFQWALNPDGDNETFTDMPTVINNSWWDPEQVGSECNSIYVNTLGALEAAGVAVIFSAGNAGNDASTITAPKNINSTLVSAFCVGNINGLSPGLPINGSSSRGPSVCGGEGSLLIKPEVSAPGTNVRSSVFNREYGLKTGTSMAAPHVAGAILLLKEAFPELLSEDLKLALYYTGVDLGDVGEDNAYGNGMIDVKAAYDYLIDEGNVPAVPNFELDLIGADADPQRNYCDGGIEMSFYVSNGGDEEITSFSYTVSALRYNTISPIEIEGTWSGSLSKGEIASVNVDLGTIDPGNYFVNFIPELPNGQEDPRPMNNAVARLISIDNDPGITYTVNAQLQNSICSGSQVLLSGDLDIDADITLQWFSNYQGTILLGEGNQWLSPVITEPTEVYVSALLKIKSGAEVPTDGEYTSDNKLRFNMLTPSVISTVDVVAEEAGSAIIQLLNADDEIVKVKSLSIPSAGVHTLNLNFDVEVGIYKLAILGGKKLLEANDGISYPYIGDGNIVITGSENGNSTYAYFFNLTLNKNYDCEPQRILLTPSEQGAFNLDLSISSDTVFVGDNVELSSTSPDLGAVSWNFGDGTISLETSPTYQYSAPGNYLISLAAVGPDGCSAAAQQEIVVLQVSSVRPGSGPGKVNFYPNPAQNLLTIELSEQKGKGDILLYDLSGRLVRTIAKAERLQSFYQVDLRNVPAGMYFINVKGEEFGDNSQKLIVQ